MMSPFSCCLPYLSLQVWNAMLLAPPLATVGSMDTHTRVHKHPQSVLNQSRGRLPSRGACRSGSTCSLSCALLRLLEVATICG
jgi:hypothetical protein